MRFALLACLAIGCSSDPETVVVYVTPDTAVRDTAPGGWWDAGDTAAPVDTTVADTARDTAATDTATEDTAPAPDTYTPPADTAPEACYPTPKTLACEPPACDVCSGGACGTRSDGCGGAIECDPCPARSVCVSAASAPARCGCTVVVGSLCLDTSGVYVQQWRCGASDVPTHPRARLKPQPDASITMWCVPNVP